MLAPGQLLGGVGGGDAVGLFADGDGAEFAVAAEDGDGVLARRRAQVEREGNDLESEEERVLDSLGEDGALRIEAIADAYMTLHYQHRSAWTQEIDLRPFKEQF